MRLISFSSLPIFVITISLLFFPKCNGKSRPSIYQYRRFTASSYPAPWRSYGGGAGGVLGGIGGEYGDLGLSYRSSRKVEGIPEYFPRQHQQLPSYKVGLDGLRTPREINYWSSYSSKPSYYSSCEYSCDDGTCLKKEYKCDGFAHCWDGSDERDCSCNQIIGEDKICDGYKDCPDGQDEKDCVYGCQPSEFTCDLYNSGSRVKCVSMTKRCDGYSDCPLGNDEHNCFRLVDLYDDEQRGVMSKGILQKRLGDNEWHTVCKTSTSTSYITQFAEKACEQIIGKVDGTIKVTTEVLSQQKNQMTKQQIQQLKYLRLAEIEAKFAVLGTCSSDLIYLVECPKPQCGGHGNYYNYEKDDRRRRRRDVDDEFFEFDLDDLDKIEDDEEEQTELIVGGYNTEEMQWPFLVGIFRDGEFYCGGSIINEYWVMTAAHCCHGYESHVFEVQAGMTRRLSWSPYEQSRLVTEIHVHEDYNSRIFANDIALYKLDKPLHLSKYVTPACLPSGLSDDPVGGMECKVAGWGDLTESGSGPDHMQAVSLPILHKCQETFTQDSRQICAGYTEGGKDACQGDSGGPLLCWNSIGKPIVNGVVSFGRGCARANEAGAYTRVSAYLDWINKVISEESNSYSLYSKRPKQCTDKCYKAGGECLFPGDKCQGKVDCLGAEDELDCTHLVTRAHETPTPLYSPYIAKPPTSYLTSPQFGMQRSGAGGSSYSPQPPPPVVTYYPYVPSVLPLLPPPPPPPQANYPPFVYPFIMQRAKARETRRVDCAPSEFKCSGKSVEQSSNVECIQETQRCDKIFDCTDKSDELECATLTSNFRGQMSHSALTETNEVKGYVLTRYQGTKWLPLVSKSWTLPMGQIMCQDLTNSGSSKLTSLETIKIQELSEVLERQTGLNLMSGQAVKLDFAENVNSQSILTSNSEKILGHASQLSKINLEKETGVHLNKNDNSNEIGDLMVAFVKCQK